MQEKLQEIRDLLLIGDQRGAVFLYKTLTEEEMEELQKSIPEYCNTEGYVYTGYNRLFLSMFHEAGTFGTFNQWRELGKIVKKGSKGFAILVPIMDGDKTEPKVKFFKKVYIFSENNVESLSKNDEYSFPYSLQVESLSNNSEEGSEIQ